MKKWILSILTVLYMGMSTGIAMDIHYCMGKRVGVDFIQSKDEKCGRCGMVEKETGCCHDEHQIYKIEDSHQTVSNDLSFESFKLVLIKLYPEAALFLSLAAQVQSFPLYTPPDYQRPAARYFHGVFRL